MRTTPMYQLLHGGQLGQLDDLVDSSQAHRKAEARLHGVGHVTAWVCEASGATCAYTATITTPQATVQLDFDPDSPAARLLHKAGVSKIPAKAAVSAYVPLGIALALVQLADGRAA